MKRKRRKTRLVLIDVIFVLLALIIVFLTYKAYSVFSEYYESAKEYEEIQKIAITENNTEEDKEMASIRVDFEKLSKVNPDIVAWIRFEEPAVINYPIVQGEDNEKYLTTTFEGTENGAGCLYVDVDNAGDFSDKNTFIYGHYKKNGHMFGALGKYKDEEYYKKHSFFEIYTPDGKMERYQIFVVTVVNASSDSYKKVYVNDEEYENYIHMVRQLALYDTGVEVTKDSQIVSLSTCTNVRVEERLMIHAVKISSE